MRRSLPSGRNDTIEPEKLDAGTQWSQDAETASRIRPFGASARPLFSPPRTGPSTIVRRVANRLPRKLPNAITRPSDATYRRDRYQRSPSGPRSPLITRSGRSFAAGTTYTASCVCDLAPDVATQSRPRLSNANADSLGTPVAYTSALRPRIPLSPAPIGTSDVELEPLPEPPEPHATVARAPTASATSDERLRMSSL